MAESTSVRISPDLYELARQHAALEHCTVGGQIEFWARVGRAALNNPDLPASFVAQSLAKIDQFNFGLSSFSTPFDTRRGRYIMNKPFEMYSDLLERFLAHKLSLQEFSVAFMERFQAETGQLDEPLFLLLDELFGDVDSTTDDPELLAEDPDFYLDKEGLETKAGDILRRMRAWRAHRVAA